MALSEERGTTGLAGILTHYFRVVAGHADMPWDWENSGEIEGAVTAFADTIESAIADEVERQVAAALEEARS